MTQIISFSDTTRSALANAVKDQLDAAPTPAKILIYTSPRPARGAAITTQSLLGAVVLNKPCGTVATGVLTLNVTNSQDSSADNSGQANWVRFVDGNDVFVGDGDAGLTNSTSVAKFNTLDIVQGVPIALTSATITAPV